MSGYGDDGNYSSTDILCPSCGRWHFNGYGGHCPFCGYSRVKRSHRHDIVPVSYNKKSNDSSLTTCPTCGRKIVAGSLCPLCHITCSNCGKKYKMSYYCCPYCKTSKPKPVIIKKRPTPSKRTNYKNSLKRCDNCGELYNHNVYISCPHCTKSDKDTNENVVSNSSAIIGFCVVVIILLIILLMLQFNLI